MAANATNRIYALYFYRLLELVPLWLAKPRAVNLVCERNVHVKSPHRLKLGSNVTIQRDVIIHCGGRAWCGYRGKVSIGDHSVIGPRCILYGAGEIDIGAYTHFGPSAIVMSQSGVPGENQISSNPAYSFEPVVIGNGCWIGAGAVILGGTTLGDRCIVGPNSVVKGNYPEQTVLIGNPARTSARTSVGT